MPRERVRIRNVVDIRRPIDEVFQYVTTPGNWPRWHPSSLAVRGVVARSGREGDDVIEDYRVAGRRGRVTCTVVDSEPPVRWAIRGSAEQRWRGTVRYTLAPVAHPGGAATRFERELAYTPPSGWWAVLDSLLLRRRVRAESAEALRRLKVALEASTTG